MLPEDPTKDSKYNENIIDSVRSQKDEVRATRRSKRQKLNLVIFKDLIEINKLLKTA